MGFLIMKENKNIMLVWKEQGIPTTPGKFIENSLITMITDKFPELKKVKGYKEKEFGLVNRLDNQTAGIVIIAKNNDSFDKLKKFTEEERIVKIYLANSYNLGKEKNGIINTPIAHHKRKKNKMVLAIDPKQYRGKPQQAKTEFKIVDRKEAMRIWKLNTKNKLVFPINKTKYLNYLNLDKTNENNRVKKNHSNKGNNSNNYYGNNEETTWILCKITKGKRHQIRIHLASKGYPILFDDLYAYKNARKISHEEHHKLYSIGIEYRDHEVEELFKDH